MNEIILNVEGMMCGGCEKRIENALGEVKAIKNIKANHEDGTVKIESKKEIDMDVVKEKIENLLKQELKEDRAKTQVEGFTKLEFKVK